MAASPVSDLPDASMAISTPELKTYIRNLGHSTDAFIREKALNQLTKKITAGELILTELQFGMLWKGLHFMVWHSDKILVQQALVRKLAKLVHQFTDEEQALLYIGWFYKTIAREWGGIDNLRLDKYFSLVRYVTEETLCWLYKKQWNPAHIQTWANALTSSVLSSKGTAHIGLVYHFSGLFWHSVVVAVGPESELLSADTAMLLISVFMEYGKICPDRTVLVKVEHDIFAPILEDHARKRPKCIPEPSVLAPLMSEKLLLLAGDKETPEHNRIWLYRIREACLALEAGQKAIMRKRKRPDMDEGADEATKKRHKRCKFTSQEIKTEAVKIEKRLQKQYEQTVFKRRRHAKKGSKS